MPEETVLLDIKDGVATVMLNRPDVHNAFDENVIARLTDIFTALGRHDEVRVVVLRGAGKSFSAGGDMNWMKRAAGYSEEENYQDGLRLAEMLHSLHTLPKLTIVAVQGAAMGGGMGLACCCDIVMATKNAKFALSEVKIGLIPATIGPYVLAALGPRQCRRYFQTGEHITAARGRDIGLVHELCENEDELEDLLQAMINHIKVNGPQAMMAAKRLCLDLAGQEINKGLLQKTARAIAQTRAGDEAKEGLSAFLEKRKASWIKE